MNSNRSEEECAHSDKEYYISCILANLLYIWGYSSYIY